MRILGEIHVLKVDFLNVGKGNCVVAKFPSGRLAIIDIDNSKVEYDNPLQDPIEFLDENYPGESIFRFVLTHPDMDHMSGLDELYQSRTITNFWDTNNNKTVDRTKMHLGGYNRADWDRYQQIRNSGENPKVIHIYQGNGPDKYWGEDNIRILGPSRDMVAKGNETEEYNHCSYVLMIEHEGIRILLGGDATPASWREILDNHEVGALAAHIFLAPHHGSSANIEKDVFKEIDPEYVVISDHYGHSYDYDYYNSLAKIQVYSTKHFGNINVEVSNTVKRIYTEKNG